MIMLTWSLMQGILELYFTRRLPTENRTGNMLSQRQHGVCVSACWVSHVRTLWIYSVHYFHINQHIYSSTGCNGWYYSLNFTSPNRSKWVSLKCLSFVKFFNILINLIGIFFETILFGYFYKTRVSLKLLYKNTFQSRTY